MGIELDKLPVDMLETIRRSCFACHEHSGNTINADRFDSFLESIDESVWLKQSQQHGLTLPLNFESKTDEVNLIATIALLNFLHAYRLPLKARTGKGAYDFVLTLVLGAYLSDEKTFLDARSMRSVTLGQLAGLGNIKTHVEKRHESLPITVGQKDEEVFELLGLVESALKTTGFFLEGEDAPSLGVWIERIHQQGGGDISAMLSQLLRVPAFADVHRVGGFEVYLMKKACFLLHAIGRLLPLTGGPLPIFVDNVIPTMLVHHGLITLAPSIKPPLLDEEHATRIRATSVVACAQLVQRAHELASTSWMSSMTEVELDGYLWSTAKLGSTRDVERLVERGTLFY